MNWHLSLALGTHTIGWAAFRETGQGKGSLERLTLEALGVRVFPDGREPTMMGKVGDTLATERRLARHTRRKRDRGRNRIARTINMLAEMGLMPPDPKDRRALETLNPYAVRAAGVERPLTACELGRAVFHLALRRGYKSSRKEAGEENTGPEAQEISLWKQRISALREALKGRTLGTFLFEQLESGQPLRFRGDTAFLSDRAMYEEEFAAIRQKQAPHHALTEADWDRLRDECILFQYPLKPVERGTCALLPHCQRAYRDTPVAQWFRMYQELNTLRYLDAGLEAHPLSREARDIIIDRLLSRKSGMTFNAMLKLKDGQGKRLFPAEARVHLEDPRQKGLEPHRIARWMKSDPVLAPLWEKRDSLPLDDIFESLHEAQEDDALVNRLVEDFRLTRRQAKAFAAVPVSSATQRLSRTVMEQLIPVMRDQGLTGDKAVAALTDEKGHPLYHSQTFSENLLDHLPYYGAVLSGSCQGGDSSKDPKADPEGHYGRFPNPGVHIAFNQVRKVVNSLIERFGRPPQEVSVELSRDLKLTAVRRTERNMKMRKNEQQNRKRREFWTETTGGREATARDLRKLKLWEELGPDAQTRRCVFTGRTITAHHLVTGEVEIGSILPFSRTLDTGMANLILAFREAHVARGNHTPFEAFHLKGKAGFDWQKIVERASRLPDNKIWRFSKNAMDRFGPETDLIPRLMTDNAHTARAARKYLTCLCPNTRAAPKRLVALVRGKWRLNQGWDNREIRDLHAHHAINAFVIGLCDRSLLQHIATASGHDADGRVHIRVPDLPDRLRQALAEKLEQLVVSYKPDHGHQGKMFRETAYGVLNKEEGGGYTLVARKPITALGQNDLKHIRDPHWRQGVKEYLAQNGWESLSKSGKDTALPSLMAAFGEKYKVRTLRILGKNQSARVIPSAPYKAYEPVHYVCCDIWGIPPGKGALKSLKRETFEGRYWAYMDCTEKGVPDAINRRPHPAARHLMRLFKNDMVAFFEEGRRKIMRVAAFGTTTNKLDLRPQLESNSDKKRYSINVLGKRGLHKIHVTPDGRVLGLKKPASPA